MASVTVDLKLDASPDVFGGWFTVDDQDVVVHNGRGRAEIDGDHVDHSYQFWFQGNPGGELDYEIDIEGDPHAKGKSVISAGRRFNYGVGEFKLSA